MRNPQQHRALACGGRPGRRLAQRHRRAGRRRTARRSRTRAAPARDRAPGRPGRDRSGALEHRPWVSRRRRCPPGAGARGTRGCPLRANGSGDPLGGGAQRLARRPDPPGGLALLLAGQCRCRAGPARRACAGGVLGGARLPGRPAPAAGQPLPAHGGRRARFLRPARPRHPGPAAHRRRRADRLRAGHGPGAAGLSRRAPRHRARPDRRGGAGRAGDPQAGRPRHARADGRPGRAGQVARSARDPDAPRPEPRSQRWPLRSERAVPGAELAAREWLHARSGAGVRLHARRIGVRSARREPGRGARRDAGDAGDRPVHRRPQRPSAACTATPCSSRRPASCSARPISSTSCNCRRSATI